MKKLLISGVLIILFSFIFSNMEQVRAGSTAPSSGDFDSWIKTTIPAFSGTDTTVGQIVSAFIPYIYGLAGFLLLIYIVLGGYQVLTSQGDPKQMAAGREKITWAVVGFLIMFSAYWIVQLTGRILDIKVINDIFS